MKRIHLVLIGLRAARSGCSVWFQHLGQRRTTTEGNVHRRLRENSREHLGDQLNAPFTPRFRCWIIGRGLSTTRKKKKQNENETFDPAFLLVWGRISSRSQAQTLKLERAICCLRL